MGRKTKAQKRKQEILDELNYIRRLVEITDGDLDVIIGCQYDIIGDVGEVWDNNYFWYTDNCSLKCMDYVAESAAKYCYHKVNK